MAENVRIRHLGLADYEPTWRAMQHFTEKRNAATADEIWFVEHPPVFTLGLNASREHLLAPGDIPVVQIDRGGQVTYHGPGQLLIYLLLDLRRTRLNVRELVVALENTVIAYLAEHDVEAQGSRDAPGVYVQGAKLASIGLRIRRGACYHGAALNVSLDPEPFGRINVCGYRALKMTRLLDLGIDAESAMLGDGWSMAPLAAALTPHLLRELHLEPGHNAISTDLQAVNSR
jgi:lipoyl(octanoyl) transferase